LASSETALVARSAAGARALLERKRRDHVVVLEAEAGRGRAHLEVGDLEDLVDAVALRLGFERGGHGVAEGDDAGTVGRQEEEPSRVLVLADLHLDRDAGFGGGAQRPARRRESIGGEVAAGGLGLRRGEALVPVDEADLVEQALDGPQVGGPFDGRGDAPGARALLEHELLAGVGQLELGEGGGEEQVLGRDRLAMRGRGAPHQAEGEEVGDEQDEGGAGDPHETLNFCGATWKPQARLRAPPKEGRRTGGPRPRNPPRSR